ncbi:MAG: transglutaminase-like domain-containing protein [Gammaproteobacteria bacterium]|nr:transglutaminase-like domain-containing protein [Gammaproteobacteria bacterium]
MLLRLSSGLLALVMIGVFALWLTVSKPIELISAERLEGERWYQLNLDGQQVGYLHTRTHQDQRGSWQFDSLTHFALTDGQPVSITDHLRFHPAPPYQLVAAEHWNQRRGSAPEGMVIESGSDGLTASFIHGAESTQHALDWDYALKDYLAFEGWLATHAPSSGDRFYVKTPDFDRGRLVNKVFHVVEKNLTGYLVESPAPLKATTIQLDASFAPIELSMAGLFTLKQSTMREALKTRTPLHLSNYSIPLDRRLEAAENIAKLDMSITSQHDLRQIWPEAKRRHNDWQVSFFANPTSAQNDPRQAIAETLTFPIFHPDVERLASQMPASNKAERQLAELVSFVHGYLEYRPDTPSTPVLETIEKRIGECTEFADLLTTLARSVGMPAITVIGLAYADGAEPALAFHAWNEVAVDGVWQAVDPTWNQIRVDATHIPLPANQAALLRMMQGWNRIRFTVDDVHYFGDI